MTKGRQSATPARTKSRATKNARRFTRFAKAPGDRCNADIGHHLDGEDGAQHQACVVTRQIVGQEPERNGGKPRTQKRHDLRGEEMAIGTVRQRLPALG